MDSADTFVNPLGPKHLQSIGLGVPHSNVSIHAAQRNSLTSWLTVHGALYRRERIWWTMHWTCPGLKLDGRLEVALDINHTGLVIIPYDQLRTVCSPPKRSMAGSAINEFAGRPLSDDSVSQITNFDKFSLL
jgi:hypothetical protein